MQPQVTNTYIVEAIKNVYTVATIRPDGDHFDLAGYISRNYHVTFN